MRKTNYRILAALALIVFIGWAWAAEENPRSSCASYNLVLPPPVLK